ncbi:hypothetical protein DFH27DRAFT_573145 [Peziza echinospora]|nr:hypothetical protein DFH27DRAFT_573145 [Peziza echinospora]
MGTYILPILLKVVVIDPVVVGAKIPQAGGGTSYPWGGARVGRVGPPGITTLYNGLSGFKWKHLRDLLRDHVPPGRTIRHLYGKVGNPVAAFSNVPWMLEILHESDIGLWIARAKKRDTRGYVTLQVVLDYVAGPGMVPSTRALPADINIHRAQP